MIEADRFLRLLILSELSGFISIVLVAGDSDVLSDRFNGASELPSRESNKKDKILE